MELNNKKDLKALLAESDMQGFNNEGELIAYSVFEGIGSTDGLRFYKELRENIRVYMNEQQFQDGKISITPLELIKVAIRNVDIDTTPQVLHIIWECGRIHQEISMKLNAMKQQEEEYRLEQERMAAQGGSPNIYQNEGPVDIAIQMDKEVFHVAELVQQLPIPQFWPNLKEWTGDFQASLDKLRILIRKLM